MKNLSDKEKKIVDKQNLAYRRKVKKINKNIIKSFIKEIKTFSKKIYWKTFFYTSYYFKTIFFFALKKKLLKIKYLY